jgi:uroporphyrinogen decarboxylase
VSEVFFPGSESRYEFRIDPATSTYVDEWGVTYHMPPDGYYYDLSRSPLAHADKEEDLRDFHWPDPRDPARLAGLPEKIKAAHEAGERLIFFGAASPGLWEHSWYLLGFENAYMYLAMNQSFMEAFTDKLLEWQIAYWDMALDAVGPYVDVVQLNEDLGTQTGPMMSPATFRKLYKPRLTQLISSIKRKTKARVYLHSCGSVYKLIPDLIECGVDALNPVQVNAVDMDSARLKREFGKDLTFWGGGCDPVLLQNGSPRDVSDEVKRRIDDLAPGGGFIFGSVHNIQANVPTENIVAFLDTAQEYGVYPINAG